MANVEESTLELLKTKAAAVGMKVVELKNLEEAITYAVDVCDKKEMAQHYLKMQDGKLSGLGPTEVLHAEKKTLAAPALDDKSFESLSKQCAKKGIVVGRDNLRAWPWMAGHDVGFVVADKIIADNPTLVFACMNEDVRLALSVGEEYVVVAPKSRLVKTSFDLTDYLVELHSGPMYTDFISSSSRTADIERVLAIGVHGSLIIHLVVTEE
ncbi:MAG: lactate utilization protein [Desulfovibrio sp.]|jgi:L-lactate dehydrogenase complex protein LldG|nr:lactate utilization protein [Desulfovibrio sp.]